MHGGPALTVGQQRGMHWLPCAIHKGLRNKKPTATGGESQHLVSPWLLKGGCCQLAWLHAPLWLQILPQCPHGRQHPQLPCRDAVPCMHVSLRAHARTVWQCHAPGAKLVPLHGGALPPVELPDQLRLHRARRPLTVHSGTLGPGMHACRRRVQQGAAHVPCACACSVSLCLGGRLAHRCGGLWVGAAQVACTPVAAPTLARPAMQLRTGCMCKKLGWLHTPLHGMARRGAA